MFTFEGDVKVLTAIIQKENEDVEHMNIKHSAVTSVKEF